MNENFRMQHTRSLRQETFPPARLLAAGVANSRHLPVSHLLNNMTTMGDYLQKVQAFLEFLTVRLKEIASPQLQLEIAEQRRKLELDRMLDQACELLSRSAASAEQVHWIVQDAVTFPAKETSRCYVDLNDCLEASVRVAWCELRNKVTLRKAYGDLPLVKCIPQRISQVFLNVLCNAADAIEHKGEVSISTCWEGDLVNVAINDNGRGMTPETMEHIFEPFFTTKGAGKGRGLGLALCYDIVRNHGGTIDVDSRLGEGTTFNIRLPATG